MNERAQRVLEFNKILEMLEAYALTDGGKALCRQLQPENDLKAVTHAQTETEEAVTLLSRLGGNPLTAFSDVNDALSLADHVILADIYAAREPDPGDISSRDIADLISERGGDATYLGGFDEIKKFILKKLMDGDLLITMGAGNIVDIGEDLLKD